MSGYVIIIIYVVLIVMVFMMFSKNKKAKKQRINMIDSIKEGDQIITIGGLRGKVKNVKEDVLVLEIGHQVVIELEKFAVSTIISDKKEN